MHLRSITLKGFKSFPDRTRLEFGPGVSVIVGPNGSGKSNITDAVLWALGEQSPLAVRGQSMQDVIFGGARGQQARGAAEVELVIAANDGGAGPLAGELPFTEISIRRRLERTGEGEYRLNGARCRLVDVLEMLSDTGLGKEMHSVVSQGRVEAIVTSKPRDRRLLVEEAAGLGKHRKRRRRAQLKLERTQDNLDRALDVEQEARSRLRPLKRQAEAAQLHERLERQSTEARWELARDAVRAQRAELHDAEREAASARAAAQEVEVALADVAARREAAEAALARRGRRHEALANRLLAVRSASERVRLRCEQARRAVQELADRLAGARARAPTLAEDGAAASQAPSRRVGELEAALQELDREVGAAPDEQVRDLERRRDAAESECERSEQRAAQARAAVADAEARCRAARERRRAAEAAVESVARERARAAAQIGAIDEFLRARAARAGIGGRGPALADQITAEPGYERALAAALAGRLGAAIASDRPTGHALLDEAGDEGGRVLIATADGAAGPAAQSPPAPGARRLAELVLGPENAVAVALTLLADAWVVDDLAAVDDSFTGIAVTRSGRAWLGAVRELHQAPAGGEGQVLAQRNRRSALETEDARAAAEEQSAANALQEAGRAVEQADAARDGAEHELARRLRERDDASDERRRMAWLIDQRRAAADRGPQAGRRAELEAALAAERRLLEQAEAAQRRRAERERSAHELLDRLEMLAPVAAQLEAALAAGADSLDARARDLEQGLNTDRAAGEGVAADLRTCAQQEAELQARLRARSEAVTQAEVIAQRLRDRCAEAEAELERLAAALGLAAEPAEAALTEPEREGLEQRIERLARRREQLGPVNPLAQDEYAEALARVEELESRRHDLETALRELNGVIAETDRRIRESFEQTFEATARHFEELVGQLFPGGRGRLRLVREPAGPSRVLGEPAERDGDEPDEPGNGDGVVADDAELLGVEIEMTPAGKSMKRLSLLSGGEKSLTALAFLFAVFLARPCPFYVLDEVEAALDDLNIDRFLRLLRRYSERAQFIVVTHQKRTMEAADTLYGVSMGDDGISKVISRRLQAEDTQPPETAAA